MKHLSITEARTKKEAEINKMTSDNKINKVCSDINGSEVVNYRQLPKKVKYDTFRNKITIYTLNDGITLTTNSDESKFTVAESQKQVVLNSKATLVISYKHIDDSAGRETDIYLDEASQLDLEGVTYYYSVDIFANRIDVIGNLTISQYGYNYGKTMKTKIGDKAAFTVPYVPFFDRTNKCSAEIIQRLKKAVVGFAENTTVEIRIYMNRDEKFLYVYLNANQLIIKCIRKKDDLFALEFTVVKPILEVEPICEFRELVAIVYDIVDNIRGDKPETIVVL